MKIEALNQEGNIYVIINGDFFVDMDEVTSEELVELLKKRYNVWWSCNSHGVCNILSFICGGIMISIEQADKIKELVALIRKADEERINFALSGIEELEAKVDNALEALDMFLDEIIDHNTRV